MSHYLVTGGAGFIGSHIVEALVAQGHAVRVLDNLSSGKRDNLLSVKDKCELVVGDIRDKETCLKACEGIDFVFHEAAIASVPRSVEDPAETHDVNVTGTLNMLLAAREKKVKRFVFASSSAVYGDLPKLPKEESDPACCLSPYALSKYAGETYVILFHRLYELETVALRYFNVFGPRQDPSSPYSGVISIFIDKLVKGETPTIYGDGGQTRDFVYIADVVSANLQAMEAPPGACGQAYNVGTGVRITVNELYRECTRLLVETNPQKNSNPRYESPRAGDIRESYADTLKIKSAVHWQPQIPFKDGLRELIKTLI